MDIVTFDIETAAAEDLHSFGPGFFRLGAWKSSRDDEVRITADPKELIDRLTKADGITGHNIINYDILTLAKYYGADYEALCRKSFDTILVERHLNPVAAKGAQPRGYYGLDSTAARYGAPGKSDDLKKLAKKHGGFHLIPLDDEQYVSYLRGDVMASEGLFQAHHPMVRGLPVADQNYIRREHTVSTSMGRVTLDGFRVDVDETMSRFMAGQQRLETGKKRLHEEFGMPLEGRYPHRTNVGKAAFRRALVGTGISEEALDANWPVSKDGSLQTGKEVLDTMIGVFDDRNPAAAELCRLIKAFNGERTMPATILDHVVGDRVHPYIAAEQGSGRWSMRDPGITVVKKKGNERALFLSDSDDEVLVCIDADQIDARIVAGMSGDKEYAKLFEPGRDLHSEVAWLVFRNPACKAEMERNNGRCDCPLRHRAKIGAHGSSYGLGAAGLARQLNVSIAAAREFLDGMTRAFPVMAQWKEEIRRQAGALGWGEEAPSDDAHRILKTAFGRPVRVERNRAYTQSCALMGQGGTRDAMAEAILRLPPGVRRRVKAVVHDEIVLSIPKEDAQETGRKIAGSMAFDFMGIPVTFGCSNVSRTWSGCYETAA